MGRAATMEVVHHVEILVKRENNHYSGCGLSLSIVVVKRTRPNFWRVFHRFPNCKGSRRDNAVSHVAACLLLVTVRHN